VLAQWFFAICILYNAFAVAGAEPNPERFRPAQKAWGLAASALLTEGNRERHDLLGGGVRTEQRIKILSQRLNQWWDVSDRASLLQVLAWIDEGGHRRDFALVGERVAPLDAQQFEAALSRAALDENRTHSLVIARDYYQKLGEKSLVGWDYARYISMCRWGYLVGYLTEPEAWERIMRAARIIQSTFVSWEELGQNYLIGREFWSYEQTRTTGAYYRAAYRRLLENPNSPWNRIPWNLDLRDSAIARPD